MPHDNSLLQRRNTDIIKRYRFYRKRNPKWTMIAVIAETANEFYLSPITVGKILKKNDQPGIPVTKTIANRIKNEVCI